MSLNTREWLLVFMFSILALEARGTYYPYGGGSPTSAPDCPSLINANSDFSASSSSEGPGIPVVGGNDVWCSRDINLSQYLTVDLGFVLSMDRILVQGKPNTQKSVTQYHIKISTNGVNYQFIQEGGRPQYFWGPWFDGDAVESTDLSNPVQARYVKFIPVEPMIQHNNHLCMRVDVQSCQIVPDPVHGNWSEWTPYTVCSKTCGGIKTRSRTCTNPAPAFDGIPCHGHSIEDVACSDNCSVNGQWSDWGAWSSCSQTCDSGVSIRTRLCNNPPKSPGGKDCEGSSSETKPCLDRYCPIDGGWSSWVDVSGCTVTCGGGSQTRLRTCSNPPPNHGGQTCPGSNRDVQPCNVQACPVDGKWSTWGSWTSCPVSCGGGSQTRHRTCTDPPPSNNGMTCEGDTSETQPCNIQRCPVDGNWSAWSTWTACSKSCDGQRSRYRECNNPKPAHGGATCVGDTTHNEACNVGVCPDPVDGKWSSWGSWSSCSAPCSPGGTRSRSRTCTNPAPSHGGQNCKGQSHMTEQCNTQACPVDGGYTDWTPWTSCSNSCEGGTRVRNRFCTNPPPSNNGQPCSGASYQKENCNTQPCPVDGGWSSWTNWSPCSRNCGGGSQYRSRLCDSPKPQHNGQPCTGDGMETRQCNNKKCPVDGGWSLWRYEKCSVSCGQGKQNRTRSCSNPPPSSGGADCKGDAWETLDCNSGPCPTQPPTTAGPPATTTPSPTPDPNATLIDLVFALSATSSNSFQAYNKMKDTVKQFIDKYGATAIHYSIIVYGGQVLRVVNFNHTFPPSANELKTAISNQRSLSGGPVLKDALDETFRIFNETIGRPKALKVLVVITDNNSENKKDSLSAAVKRLEEQIYPKGVLVISVALGAVNRSELLVISPNPLDVLSVGTGINAGILAERIMERILRLSTPIVDLGFALSATSANSNVIFMLMKSVINTIIDRYGVDKVGFSVIVYGNVATTRLSEFNLKFTQDDLIKAVKNLRRVGGPVDLGKALKEARSLFDAKARPGAKKVFVVLTDAVARNGDRALLVETARLRREGVLILSVGFGTQSDRIGGQMNTVLFSPDDYISVPKYFAARRVAIAETIMFKALQANVPLIDLTFALSATSVSAKSSYILMKRTVQSIVEKYGVNRIHYSVIVFGSVAISHIDFSTSIPDRDELIRKVVRLPKSTDSPDLVKALEKAKQVFELQEVRPNAKKVLVVILDNASTSNKKELKKAVHVLVNKSVLIIGVGVGSAVDPEQLEIITEEIRNVIRVGTGKNPDELAKEIMAIILRTSGFSEWTSWSACSRTCRYLGVDGTRKRTRFCRIPELGCVGREIETKECNIRQCEGCGEKGPLNDSNYQASSASAPAQNAALDTSNPSASRVAWCLRQDDVGGYLELNLGETMRVYRVATKGQEEGGSNWVTSYYLAFSSDGLSYSNYTQGQNRARLFTGNNGPTSVAFNNLNATDPVQYVRFFPVSSQGRPCMQAAVFGCDAALIVPPAVQQAVGGDAGRGVLIALWILAGILTFLLLMACCYYCCWHVCCGRGKKRRGFAFKETVADEGGYLIEQEQRWKVPPTAMVTRPAEDEVQEITIEMKEENKPFGVIQFGIEADETEEKHVTAEDVKSETPKYSEEIGTIKSGASMMTMSSASDAGYASTERRKRTKSDSAASAGGSGGAEFSYKEENVQGSNFTNQGYMRSQEYLAEQRQSTPVRATGQGLRRSQSADVFANVDYEMLKDRRRSSQPVQTTRDGYARMQEESGEFLHGADEGYAMGTVDVAIAGIGFPGESRLGAEPIYDMPEQQLGFIADNGGRNVYTLDNGGYRTEEWYTRGGRGPGQLREEGFKEIHVEHKPIYTEMTFGEEEFMPRRV